MRKLLVRTVQGAAMHTGLSNWLIRRQRARAILMLHGVGGPDMPARDFEALLRWLAHHHRVVGLPDMIDAVERGEPVDPRGEVALTFDDGLRNQFTVAYPLLQGLGLPATMFVCPTLIDQGRWLWNHEARARWQHLDEGRRAAAAQELGSPASDTEGLITWMKSQAPGERECAARRLRDLTPDFGPGPKQQEAFDMMHWEDLGHMDPRLVTIGSHTLSHPILTTLPDDALEHELRESRRQLEQRLQRDVALFCYPNGSSDPRVREHASRHYRAAVSTREALVRDIRDPWDIPRIPASNDLALSAWRLHRPQA